MGSQSIPFRLKVLRLEVRSSHIRRLLQKAFDIFLDNLETLVPSSCPEEPSKESLSDFLVTLEVQSEDLNPLLKLGTNESYQLLLQRTGAAKLRAEIRAQSFFGARHGLETLTQLVWYHTSCVSVSRP